MTAASALFAFIRAAAPRVAKFAGPAVAKWLATAKNREAVSEALKNSRSALPTQRLRGQLEATVLILEGIAATSEEPEHVESASQALTRARRLLIKLDLPLSSVGARRANVKEVRQSFRKLQDDLRAQLDFHEPD